LDRFEIVGSIVLGNPNWVGGVLATWIVFLLLFAFTTSRLSVSPRWKWGLFTLKMLAVTLLAICLLDPLLTRRHVRSGENIFLLLADQSASLEMRQASGEETSRGENFKSLLTDPESPWLIRLGQNFDVRRYAFGSAVGAVESFQDLSFDDPASNLATALKTLKTRFRGQPLAGIFLFSDGNSTDDLNEVAEEEGVRIFPVIPEQRDELHDLSIDSVAVSQTNFEDAPVTIQGRFAITGRRPEKLEVILTEHGVEQSSGQASVQKQSISTSNQTELVARFQVKPSRTGVLFYELNVKSADASSSSQNEATTRNNRQLIAVQRDPHVSRILYVGGRPNWEHKFLGRALESDQQLHLVSLVRIARKEARFDFRGRVGERGNSLFRGFKEGDDEETEDYSQPVLVRLNTRDPAELSGGFPSTKQELYQYDAILIDDTEAPFFTRDQQSLIERFVSERGGGLLMLGGRDTFRHGKWEHTPVADLLPVYLSRASQSLTGKLKWSLTRDGWLEPWTRSRPTEQEEKARFNEAPPLEILSPSPEIKPGARTLATVQNEQGETAPSLVVQAYGEGRTAALLTGDLWRWSLQTPTDQADDVGKFWRQLTRWLVGDVPGRIAVSVTPTQFGGFPAMTIQVRLRNQEYQPRDGDQVLVTVRQPDGSEVHLDAQPSLKSAGMYEAVHVSRLAGTYVADVIATGTENDPLTAKTGWTSDPAAEEFRRTNMNVDALQKLAVDSGGEVVPQADLLKFVTELPYREMPVMETESAPLWHRPAILLIALALLSLEWGLRRWKGLA